jgi:tetratricopeptide (TPR) repeat protein
LQHPGIAQIYEAGAADTAFGRQPWFAMELIHGQTLRVWAEAHRPNTRQRLEIMAKICEAVHHAHQRGLIHRDLKPGNILVDETGQPKILDFGVARVTDSDAQATRQTDMGQLVGTLAYMSPEQVLGDPLELDTRSDVYALGVILYELLAGCLPYKLDQKLHQALQTIREEDPTPLSSIDRVYRGDVETIVAKALEKDKLRRYASAAELAADIRRYLGDEPIVARPASVSYQLQKFTQRHKALAASVAAVFLILAAATVVSTRSAVRANQEAATANALNDFLQNDLLAQASAYTQSGGRAKPDPDLKVRTALDRAAERIAGKFDRQPEVEAAIRDTVGKTYIDLGLYAEAMKQLDRALELRRRVLGPENPKTLDTVNRLGEAAWRGGRHAEAESLLNQALQIERRVLAPEHPQTLSSMNLLAGVYIDSGKYPQAEALYQQTLEIRRRVLGPAHPDTLASMKNLVGSYYRQGKYAQGEALGEETVQIERRVLGPEHPYTLKSMLNLASVYIGQGKYAQGEALDSQTLEIQRRVVGPDHPDTLMLMSNLAHVYTEEGKYAQAEALDNETLEIRRRVLGPDHPDTLLSMNNLAYLYNEEGKYVQAEALESQALEIKRRVLGPEHPETLTSMNNLAWSQSLQGKYALAQPLYLQVLETRRRVLGPEHPYTLFTLSAVASMYQRQGTFVLAEDFAAKALEGRRHARGPEHADTMAAAADLALAWQSQGKFAASEPLAREALATDVKKRPDDWQRFRAESLLGASLAGQKKYAEAEPLLLEGYRGMVARKERMAVPDLYHLDRACEWIAELYRAWGKPEKAAEWRQELKSTKASSNRQSVVAAKQ